MANAERALEKLYEDANIRDELTDDEADLLLRWAEDQVMRLADGTDDATFETHYDALRGLLKAVNRFVGRRADLDAGAAAIKLNEMAQAIGAQPDAARLEEVAAQAATLDGAALIRAVTALFEPGQTAAATPTEPVNAQIAPVDPTPGDAPPAKPPLKLLAGPPERPPVQPTSDKALETPVEAPTDEPASTEPETPDEPKARGVMRLPFFRRLFSGDTSTDGETQDDQDHIDP